MQVPGSVAKSAEESLEAADPNIRAFEEIYRRQRLSTQEQQKSPTEVNREYYEEYCKIYLANTILLEKVKEVVEQKEELIQKMKKIQVATAHPERGAPDPLLAEHQAARQAEASEAQSQRNRAAVQMPDPPLQEVLRVRGLAAPAPEEETQKVFREVLSTAQNFARQSRQPDRRRPQRRSGPAPREKSEGFGSLTESRTTQASLEAPISLDCVRRLGNLPLNLQLSTPV